MSTELVSGLRILHSELEALGSREASELVVGAIDRLIRLEKIAEAANNVIDASITLRTAEYGEDIIHTFNNRAYLSRNLTLLERMLRHPNNS